MLVKALPCPNTSCSALMCLPFLTFYANFVCERSTYSTWQICRHYIKCVLEHVWPKGWYISSAIPLRKFMSASSRREDLCDEFAPLYAFLYKYKIHLLWYVTSPTCDTKCSCLFVSSYVAKTCLVSRCSMYHPVTPIKLPNAAQVTCLSCELELIVVQNNLTL